MSTTDTDTVMTDVKPTTTSSPSTSTSSTNGTTSMEEDDPIIAEIPVFLSQDLTQSLYLCQYPLRPVHRPYESDLGPLRSLRIKPHQKKLEMEFQVQNESLNFDSEAEYPVTSFRLSSKQVIPKTNYAVGLLRSGQLHLTPLHAIFRMRPNFDYIDQRVEEKNRAAEEYAAKRKGRGLDGEDEFLVSSDEDEDGIKEEKKTELKPVMVKIKKKESERSQAYKKLTHAYLKQMEDQEEWIKLNVFKKDTPESQLHFEKLIARDAVPIPFNIPKEEYLSYINPPVTSSLQVAGLTDESAPTGNLSLSEQTIALLKNARVLSLAQAVRALDVHTIPGVQEIVTTLDKHAHLVQGNFVIRSSLISSGRTQICRDYLLLAFSRDRIVKRSVVADVLKLDLEILNELFTEMGVRRPGLGWEFRLPTDTQISSMFPDLIPKHAKQLTDLEKQTTHSLTMTSADMIKANSTSAITPRTAKPMVKTPAKTSTSSAPTSTPSTDTEVLAAIPTQAPSSATTERLTLARNQFIQFLLQLFIKFGVVSRSFIAQQLMKRRIVKDITNHLAIVTESVMNEVIQTHSYAINETLVVRKSLSNPDVDKYRDVILPLFSTHHQLRKHEINSILKKKLGEEPSNQIYIKIMKEICTADKGGLWILKSGRYEADL